MGASRCGATAPRCRSKRVLVPIAVTEDHETLRLTVLRWARTRLPPGVPRAAAEAATPSSRRCRAARRPGLAPAAPAGSTAAGFTLGELAWYSRSWVRAGARSTPPDGAVSSLIAAHGDKTLQAELLPGFTTARSPRPSRQRRRRAREKDDDDSRAIPLTGTARPLLGLRRPGSCWCPPPFEEGATLSCLIDRKLARRRSGQPLPALNGARALGSLNLGPGSPSTPATTSRCPTARYRASPGPSHGGSRRARADLSRRPRPRQAPGPVRPAHRRLPGGQQALADVLVAVEQGAAVAWDAAAAWSESAERCGAGAPSARVAGAIGSRRPPTAQQCIRILGGIRFAWEHDAHPLPEPRHGHLQFAADGDVDALDAGRRARRGERPSKPGGQPPAEAESLPRRDPRHRGTVAAVPRATGALPWPRRDDHGALAAAVRTRRLAPSSGS